MKQEDLIKKLENIKTPDIEIQSHKQRLKMVLFSSGYFKEKPIMFWTKRLAPAGAALALILAVGFVSFFAFIRPELQIADAMEIMANDKQVRAIIEEYNLEVQEVEIKDDIAYVFFNEDVTITVDLDKETIGKIVTKVGEILEYEIPNIEELEKRIDEAKAEIKAMTTEEFKKHLIEQKEANAAGVFEERAEANYRTPEEYKEDLIQEYKTEADSSGMTVDEFKKYLGEREDKQYKRGIPSPTTNTWMTAEEYKEYLRGQEKARYEDGTFELDSNGVKLDSDGVKVDGTTVGEVEIEANIR